MSVIDPGINQQPSYGGNPAYDLEAEKKFRAEAEETIKHELKDRWNKRYRGVPVLPPPLAALNPEAADFLLSFGRTTFYDSLSSQMKLNPQQRDALPRVVWQAVLGNNPDQLSGAVTKYLATDQKTADALAGKIKEDIFSRIKISSSGSAVRRDQRPGSGAEKRSELSLGEALKKFDKLGEQLITLNPILLKIFPSPVRPSIKNWISDYYEKAEARRHDSIERGNYLFHSENAKKITSGERQRLGAVLKSLDDGSPLAVDAEKGTIIFDSENFIVSASGRPEVPSASSSPAAIQPVKDREGTPLVSRQASSGVSFSAPQRMPSELQGKSAAEVFAVRQSSQADLPNQPFNQAQPKVSGNVVDLRG